MTTCLHCAKLDHKAHPAHAKVGFGHCQTMPAGTFYSFSRKSCDKFKEAPQDIVAERVKFDERLK